jgi:hypothetical protein
MNRSLLVSLAPHPALVEHPEFPFMVHAVLDRFHCTIAEVREDYWLCRMWRALGGDPLLKGRVARSGVTSVLLTGPHYAAAPAGAERERLRLHAMERIEVDTGRPLEAFGVTFRWATAPVAVERATKSSLLAQVVAGSDRWVDLASYAGDLAPVTMPVAVSETGVGVGAERGARG